MSLYFKILTCIIQITHVSMILVIWITLAPNISSTLYCHQQQKFMIYPDCLHNVADIMPLYVALLNEGLVLTVALFIVKLFFGEDKNLLILFFKMFWLLITRWLKEICILVNLSSLTYCMLFQWAFQPDKTWLFHMINSNSIAPDNLLTQGPLAWVFMVLD